ncbi:transporter [Massilia sp. PWRC2]|uniref:transporter n=1 Tax=Massilia sp. PWRC2 TaxID=2804626 RepID=UPI003CEC55A0
MPLTLFPAAGRSALAVAFILCASAASAASAADDDTIVTDRPDFVESSAVVGKGRVQFETSVAAERTRRDGLDHRATSTPSLLRLGVSDSVELRIETEGRLHDWTRGAASDDTRGMADSSLGVKWHVRDGGTGGAEGSAPALGVLLHADLTSGARAVRAAGVRPSLRGVAEWELADEFSVGVMPGLASEVGDDGRRFTSGIAAVSVGKQWNERWRSFVELAAPRIAPARHGGSLLTFDIGGAWLLNKQCQIDAGLSAGLNRNTPDLAVTFGVSFKL